MIWKRLTATLASLFILSALLAGCGSSPTADPSPAPSGDTTAPGGEQVKPKEPATVTIWSWRPQDKDLWAEVEKRLKANGEPITIEFNGIKSTEYDSVLQTAMAGGDGPDIFYVRGGAGTKKFAEAKLIEPLTALNFSAFDQGILDQTSFESKVYGVPFAVQTLQFFYNKEIFTKENLQEPKTWDEMIRLMEQLKAKGITPLAMGGKDAYALNLIVDAVGATYLGEQWASDAIAGKTDFTDPKFVDVLKRIDQLKQFAQKDFMASAQRDARTLFGTGQAAMILDGIWAVDTYYLQTDPNMQLGAFLAPPAKVGDPVRMYAYVDGGFAVNTAAKKKDAAMTVIAFTATDEFAQLYADMLAEIPGNRNVKFSEKKPMLQQAVKTRNDVGLKVLFRIRSPFDAGSPDISTSLGANLQGMLSNKITAEQVGQAVQRDLASWYPAFKK